MTHNEHRLTFKSFPLDTDNSHSVEKLFNSVAPNYDILNDLLSLGLHRIWKKQLLDLLRPIPGENWLDLCCGTGDLAFRLSYRLKAGGSVVGIDTASQQLALASKRSEKETFCDISWVCGDALNTGLPSKRFDGAVMAYGLRNLADPLLGLKESLLDILYFKFLKCF